MSLLMQALKKAERAKQNHPHDDELAKPSEAFDDVLTLAPQEPLAATALPIDTLSLSPLEAPAPDVVHASEAAAFEAPRRPRNTMPPPSAPKARPRRPVLARMDARTMRLAVLSGIALLIAAVFAYIYWNAVYGAGSSRHLPMVPMPGQNLPPQAGPAIAAVPGFAVAASPASPASDPALAQQFQYVPAGPASAAAPSNAAQPPLPPPSYQQGNPDAVYRRPEVEQAPDQQVAAILAGSSPSAPAPAPASIPAPMAMPAAPPQMAAPASSAIKVARASKPAQVSPALQNGFNAYQRGDLSGARQSYQSALRADPNSRDALLGVAALALRDNQPEQAAAAYTRLLDIDPNDNDALAGLTSLRQGDPAQAESRLKRVLDRQPESGSVLFALGNLYARQGRWPEAQQQYFRAYSSTPGNADYAFNLAVGLDRLNQSKLALTYYQRALELAPRAPVNFDIDAAATRARELGGQ